MDTSQLKTRKMLCVDRATKDYVNRLKAGDRKITYRYFLVRGMNANPNGVKKPAKKVTDSTAICIYISNAELERVKKIREITKLSLSKTIDYLIWAGCADMEKNLCETTPGCH